MCSLLDTLQISTCVVASVACGALMPFLLQRIEAQKAEVYGRELPYTVWPVWRTVALCTLFVACSILCAGSFAIPQAVIATALVFLALGCAVIDLDMRLIPNQFVLAIGILGIALRLSIGVGPLLNGLVSMLVALGFLGLSIIVSKVMRGKPGMGAGDFKLLVVTCLAVGWPGLFFMAIGFSLGVVVMSLYQLFYLRLGFKSSFPMAPAIVSGLVCGLVYPSIPFLSGLIVS